MKNHITGKLHEPDDGPGTDPTEIAEYVRQACEEARCIAALAYSSYENMDTRCGDWSISTHVILWRVVSLLNSVVFPLDNLLDAVKAPGDAGRETVA